MPANSDPFKKMAERIEHNADATFGGAVVIIPPLNGGDPIELLMLDSAGSAAQFWSTLKTRIQIVLDELEQKQRMTAGFGHR